MNITTQTKNASADNQSTDDFFKSAANVVQFPRHPLTDWSRYQPVKLDPKDRSKLLPLGWQPVPLSGKACLLPGWTTINIDESTVVAWAKERPADAGTGMRCGSVSGIDVDIAGNDDLCSDVAHAIELIFGAVTIARRGTKGLLIPVQCPQSIRKRVLSFTDATGTAHKIELLATGQQFGAFGHVDAVAGKHAAFDYTWANGASPLDTQTWELPLATVETLDRFFALVTERLTARGCTIGKVDSFDGKVSDKKGDPIRFADFARVASYVSPAHEYGHWFERLGALADSNLLIEDAPDDFSPHGFLVEWSRGDHYAGDKSGPEWVDGVPASHDEENNEKTIRDVLDRAGREGNRGYGFAVNEALANGMPVQHESIMDKLDLAEDGQPDAVVKSMSRKSRFNLQRVSKDRTESVDYIIDDYIPAGMRGLFYGGEQSLKTTAAVKIGVDIAMPSVAFHGDPKRKGIEYRVSRHGAVVYVAAEDSPGVKARAREAMLDRDPKCDPVQVPFYVLDDSFKVTNTLDVDDLIAVIESKLAGTKDELALVVLDTTVFVLDGHLSEDKSETVTLAYEGADKIIKHFKRRCSVVFVHHTGKDATKGARGSSNWVASSEFRYQFKPKGEAKAIDGSRTIRFPVSAVAWNEKLKNQPLQQPVNYISRRVVFDATRVDGNGKATKVKGSTLLLDVAPYEEAKVTAGTLSDIDIVKLIVDREQDGHHFKLLTLAINANTFGLLASESDSDKWIDAFRKRIKRLLDASRREGGPDYAMKFGAAVASFLKCNDTGKVTKDGAPMYEYLFVGRGGKLGVWAKYQQTLASQKAAAEVAASDLSGIPEIEDFGDLS